MALPHREWSDLEIVTTQRQSADNSDDHVVDWTTDHLTYNFGTAGLQGNFRAAAAVYQAWHTLFKPRDADFALLESMDECIDYGFWFTLTLGDNSAGDVNFTFRGVVLADPTAPDFWDFVLVNGKYYDGVNVWTDFPPGSEQFYDFLVTIADMPYNNVSWMLAYSGVDGTKGNVNQDDLFRNGVRTEWTPDSVWGIGEGRTGWVQIQKLRVNYLNPVVNSFSRPSMPAAGGVPLVLTGLGFNQSDAELGSAARNPDNGAGAWNSIVDEIDFIGLQGQATTNLTLVGGDFTVDSDTQITIASMPALAAGTYAVRLFKNNVGPGGGTIDIYSYAGDWTCDIDGLTVAGARRSFLVGEITDPPKPPILNFKWGWIIGGLPVDKWYAPIDIRAPEIFWDGRVLGVSTLTRSIDSMTGMFTISDMDVEMASNDMEFQKLLAQGHCKNQVVEILHGWATEPVGWMQHMFHGIVDDYTPKGPKFTAMLKDVSRRHFRKTMPRLTITTNEYPNAHDNAVSQGVPELIGLHSHTTGATPGAIEALCTDTTLHKYIAAMAPIGITGVYSAGALIAPANYAITFEDGGRTYITFTADQGDNKITFNCTGYTLAAWDSANGYVQNPAYVLGFYLVYLCRVPIDFMDIESLDVVAQQFVDTGYDEIGRLALVENKAADAYLQELLFSFGIKMWPDMRGRFKFGRKDITNYATDLRIFAQIDSQDSPARPYDLRGAVNYAKARWDYQPAASLWAGADEQANQGSIDTHGERHEASWDYPWISSAAYAAARMGEDMRRLAYGHRTVSFDLPLEFIERLDIFDNFRLQDPFDIHPTGAGNEGHYYYVTSLNYDFQNQKLGVVAEDLQWLMARCSIIGKCAELNGNYNTASEWQRTFSYIGRCAQGTFANGDPNKKICICN